MDVDSLIVAARIEIENVACKTGISPDQLYLVGGAVARWRHNLPQADYDFVTTRDPEFSDETLKLAHTTLRAWSFGQHQISRYKFGAPPNSIDWFDLAHGQSWVGMYGFYVAPEVETKTIRFLGVSRDYIATLGRMVKWLNLGFTMNKVELLPVIAAIHAIPEELYIDILGSLNVTSTGADV